MSKLQPRYEGPFKVLRCNKGGAYILEDNTGALLPRNFAPSALKLISHDAIYTDQSHEVEAIVNHKGKGQRVKYLVKWKNYDDSHNTWEPAVKILMTIPPLPLLETKTYDIKNIFHFGKGVMSYT